MFSVAAHKLNLDERKSQELLKHFKICNLVFLSFYKSSVSVRFKEFLQYNQLEKDTPIALCMKQKRVLSQ